MFLALPLLRVVPPDAYIPPRVSLCKPSRVLVFSPLAGRTRSGKGDISHAFSIAEMESIGMESIGDFLVVLLGLLFFYRFHFLSLPTSPPGPACLCLGSALQWEGSFVGQTCLAPGPTLGATDRMTAPTAPTRTLPSAPLTTAASATSALAHTM